jgi:hypothetical protein
MSVIPSPSPIGDSEIARLSANFQHMHQPDRFRQNAAAGFWRALNMPAQPPGKKPPSEDSRDGSTEGLLTPVHPKRAVVTSGRRARGSS